MIKVGKMAPIFNLQGVINDSIQEFKLENQKGRWTVVFFYPLYIL